MAEFAGALGGWEELFSTPLTAKVPSLGVNYMEASKPEVAVGLPHHGRDLCFVQRLDEHGIGGIVWDCGAAAAASCCAVRLLCCRRGHVCDHVGDGRCARERSESCYVRCSALTVADLLNLPDGRCARAFRGCESIDARRLEA